jgi:hypothetical protein
VTGNERENGPGNVWVEVRIEVCCDGWRGEDDGCYVSGQETSVSVRINVGISRQYRSLLFMNGSKLYILGFTFITLGVQPGTCKLDIVKHSIDISTFKR